jgi:C4-dicarboxylate-specific signal transduction histidine kinase
LLKQIYGAKQNEDQTAQMSQKCGTELDACAATAAMDVTKRSRADRERDKLRHTLEDLALITRVNTMGELTASLAHEIKQPIAAAVTNANTCLRWLGRDQPDLKEASDAASRVVRDLSRASDITVASAYYSRREFRNES